MPSDAASNELDKKTLEFIDGLAISLRASIEEGELPAIELPVRGLEKCDLQPIEGIFRSGARAETTHAHREYCESLCADVADDGCLPNDGGA